jgi:hypothetical protein
VRSVELVVRQMILCDDVQIDPHQPHKVNVYGLVDSIVSASEPLFPLTHPELCVFLQLTSGRGTGTGQMVVVVADSEQPLFASQAHAITFSTNPLAVRGVIFRILNCVFPGPGLYWVDFRFDGKTLNRQPLSVR